MAVSSSYRSSDNNEIHERLKWSFSCPIDKSDFLKQSKDFRTIEGWYKQVKKTSDSISSPSIVVDEMINELLKHVYPYYTNFIIDKINTKIQFTGTSMETNFDIGIVSMKPYVEFIKIVDGQPTPPAKFSFQLDISTHITIVKTLVSKYIEIRRLGVDLEILLLQMPYLYLSQPIKLTTKTFDIQNIRFPLKRQS